MSLGAAGTKGREVCSSLDPVLGIPAQLQDHPGCEQQQPHLDSWGAYFDTFRRVQTGDRLVSGDAYPWTANCQ